jgi:protein-S-isoprenylcysteine O-methyltransferase Ste14
VAALYLPVLLALLAGFLQTDRHRQFVSCLLSGLWVLWSLLLLERLNARAGWWSFATDGIRFHGMPLELYLGWVVLWGFLPQLAFPRLALAWSAAIMVAADVAAMPVCAPVVRLGPLWLAGEGVAVVLVLVPALCIARWTREDTRLPLRAAMQVAIAGAVFLYILPELVFARRPSAGWETLLRYPGWLRQLAMQGIALLAVPGVSAVMEFAQRGGGTPLPYDPPKRLVASGIYRYCANPMQLSCFLVMVCWAVLLRNGWLLLAAALTFVYSAGIAEWDEGEDLARRFGDEWTHYRAAVPRWVPRWRPYCAGIDARLYIAGTCGPCSEVRVWLESRNPVGLEFVAAEELPQGSIRRLRYEPADGTAPVEGVRAFARALEHLNLGWALAGATLRLPVVWQFVQLLMDASGLGPRTIGAVEPSTSAPGRPPSAPAA